jgi:hypothetical protein
VRGSLCLLPGNIDLTLDSMNISNIFKSEKQTQAGGLGCGCSQDGKLNGQEEGKWV